MKRRDFIKNTSVAGAGLTLAQKKKHGRRDSKLSVAILGSGFRGQSHISLLLNRSDCRVIAIADPDKEMVKRTKAMFSKSGNAQPMVYDNGQKDYINLLDKEKPDVVIISSPWMLHTEMAIACLERNIYTGMEVCGGFSIEECWALIRAEEKSESHLFFLENVCYRRDVMAILNMVRQNLFGELIHLECGYQHDLRGVKFNDGKTAYNSGVEFGEKGFSEAKWRTQHSVHRNGDLYPTHGIGPVAQMININRGNRFLYLTSVASKARGLHNYIVDHPKGGSSHPNAKLKFKLGDKVTTSIVCNNGETVILHHDTNLPRPYSLGFRVQGEKGLWMAVNKSIHIEGLSESHRWESQDAYLKKYDHPLWKRWEQKAVGAGHGGMDFFLVHSLLEHAKNNEVPPFDVYDAATWLAITPLSEQSIATGSQPQPFPDFTRGKWLKNTTKFALNDAY
ncbi:MAG: Gfo/Idh/MocA family oxidoreductase [Saprospiraceae bacterium]|nr:Gfo/Idh/MocA family oxidoreductase [Saprospiraceae bacterium]